MDSSRQRPTACETGSVIPHRYTGGFYTAPLGADLVGHVRGRHRILNSGAAPKIGGSDAVFRRAKPDGISSRWAQDQ